MKILLSAYACAPHSGTEPGNGWGWATHLAARGLEVHLFTTDANQLLIEAELEAHPGLYVHFFPHPTKLLPGDGFRYASWQHALVKFAREVHKEERFDIAHHVTFGSVHVPTQLWRLGIPTVFGPVGGGQVAPKSMLRYFGVAQRKEKMRTLITKLLRYSPVHRFWLGRMTAVFVSNRDTLELVRKLGRRDATLMADASLPDHFLAERPRTFKQEAGPLRLLWVGRMLPRKALNLTLDILANTTCLATLTLVGAGQREEEVREMIATRGLQDRVTWSAQRIPWSEVRMAYSQHDALLFTSLRDSCAAQLLEAMAQGLPIITLDLHGAQDLVPDSAGIKVPVRDAPQVVKETSAAVDRFAALSPKERTAMSSAGWSTAKNLTFRKKAKFAESLYRRLLAEASTH